MRFRRGTIHTITLGNLWLLVVLATRLVFTAILRQGRLPRRVLVFATPGRAREMRELLRRHQGPLFEPVVVEPQHVRQTMDTLKDLRVWAIVVADGVLTATAAKALETANLLDIPVFSDASFQERHLGRIDSGAVCPDDPVVPAIAGTQGPRKSSSGFST